MTTVAAFTLVEMSIVLIIIGLIVAGIAKGQDMIRAAKISAIVQDFNKYQIATFSFDDKYGYLPGDLPNATDYWPSISESGNGNREINFGGTSDEDVQAWNHLGFAKMIDFYSESFSGWNIIGQTCPASPIDGVGYWFSNSAVYFTSETLGKKGNFISLASRQTSMSSSLRGGAITAAEASQIDKKIDDGKADDGKLYGIDSAGTTDCLKNKTYSSGDYDLSKTENGCRLIYWIK